MVCPYETMIKNGAVVLDPSAGKGDLLRAASYGVTRYGAPKRQFLAVEIDPNLRSILKDTGFSLIGEDWLNYSGHYHFDIILMNPPFQNGATHLLHAWNSLKTSGHICCLLNAETVDNAFSAERQLLKDIIEKHGSVEYLGDCFSNGERKTGTQVVMVRLQKKAETRFQFDGLGSANAFEFDEIPDSMPAKRDLIGSFLLSYERAAKALEAHVKAEFEFKRATADFFTNFYSDKSDNETIERASTPSEKYNLTMDKIRKAAWHQVFSRTRFREVMTEKVRAEFAKSQSDWGISEFNEQNILTLLEAFLQNRNQILHQCIVDVFDMMCSYDEKNKNHTEGWKTNDSYRVNRKVILPWFITCDNYASGRTLSVNHRRFDQMADIDRAMCLIAGKNFSEISDASGQPTTLSESLRRAVRENGSNPGKGESEFFTFKYFIKGTVHLMFKDKYTWDEFNRRAAAGKGWLGDG